MGCVQSEPNASHLFHPATLKSRTLPIFSVGFLLYTIMLKVAVPVTLGEFKHAPSKS